MELRPYQEKAKKRIFEEWNQGHKKTLLVQATGTGKTIVFANIIKEILEQNPSAKVLILAHRDELLRQAQDKLRVAAGIDAGIEKAQETTIGTDIPVVIGSVQSMSGKRLDDFPVNYFTHIIIDEAHHATSQTYTTVLAHFPDAYVLGVTATPKRADQKSLARVFDSTAFEYNLKDAIKDGYLSPIKAQCIPLELDISRVAVNAGDYAPGEIANTLDPYLEQIAVKMETYCKGRKTIVFTPLVKTSKTFRDILSEHGFSAVEVNGQSGNRKEALEGFANGTYDVLTNAMLVTEGYDELSVDCIVCLRPTQSESLYQQIVGRGTRLCEGKKDLLLLDFLWLTGKHKLCKPADLFASDEEIAKKMCGLIDESKDPLDLMDLEEDVITEINRDREEALARQLDALKRQKAQYISSLQFFASLEQLDDLFAAPIYAWEREKPTTKQLLAIEKFGLDSSKVETKGVAAKILDICFQRKEDGLSTVKQIKLLERYGFVHVGKWTFEEANAMIDRLAKNHWKVPFNIRVSSYKPMRLKENN